MIGSFGPFVLAGFITMTAPVRLDVRLRLAAPAIDFSRELDGETELPAKQIELDGIELRDATVDGDWARQVDYELAATRGPWSIAVNHHFVVRNMGEAQVVASFAIEY